jgi:hypothetical protein
MNTNQQSISGPANSAPAQGTDSPFRMGMLLSYTVKSPFSLPQSLSSFSGNSYIKDRRRCRHLDYTSAAVAPETPLLTLIASGESS